MRPGSNLPQCQFWVGDHAPPSGDVCAPPKPTGSKNESAKPTRQYGRVDADPYERLTCTRRRALPLLVVHVRDGNGRVGRLLIAFLLCEQEVLAKPVLYRNRRFAYNRYVSLFSDDVYAVPALMLLYS